MTRPNLKSLSNYRAIRGQLPMDVRRTEQLQTMLNEFRNRCQECMILLCDHQFGAKG